MNSFKEALIKKINRLRQEKDVVIFAHFYQIPEIQDIADFIGDSLALAQQAHTTNARMILFSGVHFMAETAKILNPSKKVIIPDMEAGCSLADSCPPDDFKAFKAKYPDHIVISYINCSARIKAMSDVICTSSNAIKIVESFPRSQKIIFAPDKNLGGYVNSVTGREMVLWNGTCEVHDMIKTEALVYLMKEHPDALVIAHPECKAVVLEMADFIGSTTSLLKFTSTNPAKKFIVATETGILHAMKKTSPEKEFLIVPTDETCSCNDCPFMKKNTLEKILSALETEKPEIILDDTLISQAKQPILKMLVLSV
ncbi:MAG: quinolinate synthase NadA [bacterium]